MTSCTSKQQSQITYFWINATADKRLKRHRRNNLSKHKLIHLYIMGLQLKTNPTANIRGLAEKCGYGLLWHSLCSTESDVAYGKEVLKKGVWKGESKRQS